MPQKLIVIRGNSGSGKSTVSQRLKKELDGKVMLIEQDILRREILKPNDTEGSPVVGLIEELATYGKSQGYDVILEGILSNQYYGDVTRKVIGMFDETYVYYLDISFEETVQRHNSRIKSTDFGEEKMREWWLEKDYLSVENEQILGNDLTEDEMVTRILSDVN